MTISLNRVLSSRSTLCLDHLARRGGSSAHPAVRDQTITVSAATLAGLPRVKVEAKEHDNPTATYEGLLLGSILELAGVPRGEKLCGKALRSIVVNTASGGYEVVFTLPDTDPAFTDRLIVLADKKRTVSHCPRR